MLKESSNIEVIYNETVVKSGFHDEFDALEWIHANYESGKFTIRTERKIII